MKYRSSSIRFLLMLIALMFVGHAVHAAETDLANAPLASSSTDVVKPNVMFILDDSGSMASVSYTHLTLPTTPYV